MAKIALTGTHGGGKTTLGRLLATTTSHDLITEKARWAAADLGYVRPSNVPSAKKPLYQWHGLIAQISAEDRNENFVSDRATLDYAAYFKMALREHIGSLPHDAEDVLANAVGYHAIDDYVELCRRNMARYDAIILVPANSHGCHDDGGRFTHGVEMIDNTIRAYAEAWDLSGKIYEVRSDTPDDRLSEVLGLLRSRNILS